MADYTRREVTPPTRVEYVLPSPTNGAELGKAYSAAHIELGAKATYDDTITVEARDDEIVLWFEKPDGAP